MNYHFPNGDSHLQVESILTVQHWGSATLTKAIVDGEIIHFDLAIGDKEVERFETILNLNHIPYEKPGTPADVEQLRAALARLADRDDQIHAGCGGPWQDFASIILTGKPVPLR